MESTLAFSGEKQVLGPAKVNEYCFLKAGRHGRQIMKRTMMVAGIFATMCLVSATAQAVDFNEVEVQFDVKANKGEVTATSGNNGCNFGQGQKKGCVNFPKNSIALIKFSIANQQKTCADPSAKWVISKVELTDKGYLEVKTSDTSKTVVSDKGIFEETPNLPNWLLNAFPQLDEDTGELYKAPTPREGMTQVTRLNLNNNKYTQPAKDIWYRVSVANCKGDEIIILVSDPRFENDGADPH